MYDELINKILSGEFDSDVQKRVRSWVQKNVSINDAGRFSVVRVANDLISSNLTIHKVLGVILNDEIMTFSTLNYRDELKSFFSSRGITYNIADSVSFLDFCAKLENVLIENDLFLSWILEVQEVWYVNFRDCKRRGRVC